MLLGNAQGDANMLIACQLILSESIPTATEEESLVLDALPLLAEVAKEAAHASTLPSQATSSGAAASAVKVTFDQIGQA